MTYQTTQYEYKIFIFAQFFIIHIHRLLHISFLVLHTKNDSQLAAYIDQITALSIHTVRTHYGHKSNENRNKNETAEEAEKFCWAFSSVWFGYENEQNWFVVCVFFSSNCTAHIWVAHNRSRLLCFVWCIRSRSSYRNTNNTNNNSNNIPSATSTERVLTLANNIKTTFQIRMAHVKNGRYNYVTYNPYPFLT